MLTYFPLNLIISNRKLQLCGVKLYKSRWHLPCRGSTFRISPSQRRLQKGICVSDIQSSLWAFVLSKAVICATLGTIKAGGRGETALCDKLKLVSWASLFLCRPSVTSHTWTNCDHRKPESRFRRDSTVCGVMGGTDWCCRCLSVTSLSWKTSDFFMPAKKMISKHTHALCPDITFKWTNNTAY